MQLFEKFIKDDILEIIPNRPIIHAMNLSQLESVNRLPLFKELNIFGIVVTRAITTIVVIPIATDLQLEHMFSNSLQLTSLQSINIYVLLNR